VNLAVVFGSQSQILECLAGTDVPFMYMDFGEGRKPGGKYAGYMEMSVDAALEEFVAHCVRARVRSVAVVGKAEERSFSTVRLADAGINVTRIAVKAARGLERVENLERETCRTLDRLFDAHGRGWLPDLMFVEDDYQAIGALFSLLSHGVRLPNDMRFAMTKNYGNGPALPQSITCVEFNPAVSGSEIGRVAAEFLGGGTAAYERSTGYRYVIGDTFPELDLTTKEKEK
jgi:DNA-binding LacI/PurR family transcriptional regulator